MRARTPCLTVVCDQFTGKVVWAASGRSKVVVGEFFDALAPNGPPGWPS